MKHFTLEVPAGIKFISDWKEFKLLNFPHILDKKIPGCGFTEYCLKNNQNVILCSPRKILLIDKEKQHNLEKPGSVLYVRNTLDKNLNVDRDLTKNVQKPLEDPDKDLTEEEKKKLAEEALASMYEQIDVYISIARSKNYPLKIMVTYDSYRIVKDILKKRGIFNSFYTVVDEMQSVFVDATFKSSTEMEFMDNLKDVQDLCFVSATPMIEKYLEMLDEFKDLPYYELDWLAKDPYRLTKPQLKVRTLKSVVTTACSIIDTYRVGKYEEAVNKSGILVQSKEAVLFVNSVNNIISIIKKAGLKPDEVNILVSDTIDNNKKLRKRLGKKFSIGEVPIRGEQHKMFTLCTRTVYLGADFYSDNARTFILSDANIKTLAVDITLDLPQILGRQRLEENPWTNRAELYFKTICPSKKLTKDLFDREIEKKKKVTNNLLLSYTTSPTFDSKHDLANAYKFVAVNGNYKESYVAVNEHMGSDLLPVFNNLVLIAEMRAFDIQQIDYADRFTVFNKISEYINPDSSISRANDFMTEFEYLPVFRDKMKYFCEFKFSSDAEKDYILGMLPLQYQTLYKLVGPVKMRALGYDSTKINKELENTKIDKSEIIKEVYSRFTVGNKYIYTFIKTELQDIYNKIGYSKTAKATDLEDYFEIKPTLVLVNGKKTHGFNIISKL